MIFCKLDTWVPYKMLALTSPGTGAQGDEFATTSPVILGAGFAGRKARELVEQPALRCKFLPVSQDRRLRIATATAGGQARYGLALRRPNKGTFKSLCERLWRKCTWTLQYKSAPLGWNVPLVDASLLFVRMTKDFTRTLTYTNADITEGIKTLGASLAKSTGHKPWDLRREKANSSETVWARKESTKDFTDPMKLNFLGSRPWWKKRGPVGLTSGIRVKSKWFPDLFSRPSGSWLKLIIYVNPIPLCTKDFLKGMACHRLHWWLSC